jgi:hypothetical protein
MDPIVGAGLFDLVAGYPSRRERGLVAALCTGRGWEGCEPVSTAEAVPKAAKGLISFTSGVMLVMFAGENVFCAVNSNRRRQADRKPDEQNDDRSLASAKGLVVVDGARSIGLG